MMVLRPMRSDREPKKMKNGVASASAMAMRTLAVASSIFVTMVTDSMGFLAFLGLATAVGLVH